MNASDAIQSLNSHQPTQRRAADEIVDLLSRSGVRTIFGLPGAAISPIYDSLLDHPEIRVVNCKQETMAVFAAAAHARATDSVAVVLVTSGPGVTNAITGLASANCDGIPLLLLGGEVLTSQYGRGALQEGGPEALDLRAMLERVTKASFRLSRAQSATAVMRKALATARSGRRGSVFVSLPFDLLSAEIVPTRLETSVASHFEVDGRDLDEAAALLAAAERPLIIAGSGARWGRGPKELLGLAERGKIPVITSPKAKGVFPESHPLALGIFGFGGHPSAQRYLEAGVDVLLAVGAGFGEVATNAWDPTIRASRSFVQIDVDASQIGKNYRADLGLLGPAEVLLRELRERLPKRRQPWKVQGLERHEIEPRDPREPGMAAPEAIVALQRALPSDTVFCGDVGDHLLFALHYLTIDRPDAFYFAGGLGSMGSGLGAAIGLKLAMPDRPVCCICGDGTLSMFGTELLTVAEEKLDIVFAVLNDGGYGMGVRFCDRVFGRSAEFRIPGLDVPALARSLGLAGRRIERPAEIAELGAIAGPTVLDLALTRAAAVPLQARFNRVAEAMSEAA